MAVNLSFFRVGKVTTFLDELDHKWKKHESSEEKLIEIDKLFVSDEIADMLKKVNVFLELREFERASEAADKIITEYPESAAGWYAKAIAITDNFCPRRTFYEDMQTGFMKYRQNALKKVSPENRYFILREFERYKQSVLEATVVLLFMRVQNGVSVILNRADDAEENFGPYILGFRHIWAQGFDESFCSMTEELIKAYPSNLVFNLYYAMNKINCENFENQLKYFNANPDDDVSDYYDRRSIKDMPLSEKSLTEFLRENNLRIKQADEAYEDGFISYIATLCQILQIDMGDVRKYYTPEALVEIEQMEREEAERLAEEERQRIEAHKRKLEEERRRKIEQQKRERRDLIIKLSLVAGFILLLVVLAFAFKDDISDFFGASNSGATEYYEAYNEFEPYYVISNDYNSINVRSGAGTDNSVVTKVTSDSLRMYPTGKTEGEWIQVSSDEFSSGWVHESVVKYVSQ